MRCLKVWENTQEKDSIDRYAKNGKHDQFKRCIECGRNGHFKCTKENKSKKINLTFKVQENLDEFFVSESSSSEDDDNTGKEVEFLSPRKRELK